VPVKRANAGRRPDIEKKLTDSGFTWEYRADVPLESFDRDKSLRNQARLGEPLNEQTVERYEAALLNGSPFPAIVANAPTTTAKLVIADGNHRFEAHYRHKKPIDTYIIAGAKPQAITMFTFEANNEHGLSTSREERIHHALWLVDGGVPLSEAAKRMVLSTTALRKAAVIVDAAHRADDVGILRSDWDKLSPGHQTRLYQISTDEGFKAMTDLTVAAGMSTSEITPVVTALNE